MSFYTEVLQTDPRFTSTDRINDLALLEPVTRAAVQQIISQAAAQGITLKVTETFRSQARQRQLFDQGATKLEKVGTHGYGLACDFCKIVEGKASWDGDWTFLRNLAVANGLISGLDWGQPDVKHSFIDADHVQRVAVADQDKLFSGVWYPDDTYLKETS